MYVKEMLINVHLAYSDMIIVIIWYTFIRYFCERFYCNHSFDQLIDTPEK